MIILISSLSIIALAIGTGCYMSKRRYDESLNNFLDDTEKVQLYTTDLEEEFDRIEELQENLREIRDNVDDLDIPTPESVSFYDDTQTTINKLSSYFEEHSLATVGTEQLILQSIHTSYG